MDNRPAQKEAGGQDSAAESRYRALFDQSPDGIIVIGADGTFIEFNEVTHLMLGYGRDEFAQLRISDIAVDSPEKIKACIGRLLSEGKAEFETRYKGKDGGIREVHVISRTMEFSGQRVFHSIWRDVTETNRTKALLEKQKMQMEEAQKIGHFGNWEWNPVDDASTWSDEMYRIFGLQPQEMHITYAIFLEFVHAEDRATVDSAVKRALSKKQPYSLDVRILPRNGAAKMVNLTGQIVCDGLGRPVLLRGIGQDITERRKVEDSLRERDEQFRLITETISEVFWMADEKINRIFYVSPGFEKIWGRSRQSLYENPRSFLDAIHPDDRERAFGTLGLQESGQPFDHQYRIVQPTGALRWIWDRGYPVRNADGSVHVYVGVAQDITEYKRAETLSKEKDELIKNILDAVGEGFIVVDRYYKVLLANKAYCRQVNVPDKNIIGAYCYNVAHRLSRPCFETGEWCAVRETFETGEPHSSRHKHYDHEGNAYYVETRAYPLKTNAKGEVTSVIQTITDVSENKKLENQLQHAQKMEAIGLLAGGVAHDFNNILTALRGYADLAKMKLPGGYPGVEYLEEIIKSSNRASDLTRSLLAFSRKQTINLKPVNVNSIIRNVGNLLARIIGEDIQLRTDVTDQDLVVVADTGQVEQILMNLATNARDAMQSGGLLTVKTEPFEIGQDFLKRHGFGRQGNYALVTVSDTGIGMDAGTRSRIFEPYFTTKETGKGTGLGLSMVYGIVKQHRGYIIVESEPGRGTIFKIYLPRVQSRTQEDGAAKRVTALTGTGTILLAEDDDLVRNLVTTVLTEFGYSVISSSDGEQAIEKFADNKDQIDLLVFDMIMPKKNGIQAYEEIRKIQPGIKALFMSGYLGDTVKNGGKNDLILNIVEKPISQMDLLVRIREAMTGSL